MAGGGAAEATSRVASSAGGEAGAATGGAGAGAGAGAGVGAGGGVGGVGGFGVGGGDFGFGEGAAGAVVGGGAAPDVWTAISAAGWVWRTEAWWAARGRRGGAGSGGSWTTRRSAGGGATSVRWGWAPRSSTAGSESTEAIAPVISAAARTRAQTLMFLPSLADNPFEGCIGNGGAELKEV